uniref:Uncharacterized protein n=1 Tax=Opuntia streptacantha TaxID=393608 RepID=A0A7C9DKS5_OPUST
MEISRGISWICTQITSTRKPSRKVDRIVLQCWHVPQDQKHLISFASSCVSVPTIPGAKRAENAISNQSYNGSSSGFEDTKKKQSRRKKLTIKARNIAAIACIVPLLPFTNPKSNINQRTSRPL